MRHLLLILLPAGLLAGDESHRHALGRVHFAISCSQAAQTTFDRGIALLHSFWYDEAERTFSQIVRAEPACAMGYWGIAMSLYHPVWAPPSLEDLKEGAAAVAHAKSAGEK